MQQLNQRFLFYYFSFAILILSCYSPLSLADSETQVKAIFLERFTRFTQWPSDSNVHDPDKPFVLGVLDKGDFVKILREVYHQQKIKGKPVEIKVIHYLDSVLSCHLLFIGRSYKKELSWILAKTRNRPILTVSDTTGFANKGVLINLYLVNRKIRFEINQSALQRSGLKMSYNLLSLAKIIHPFHKP